MRILVTGSRHAHTDEHRQIIRSTLTTAHALDGTGEPVTLIHGKCPYGGADLLAHYAAVDWSWAIETFPADVTTTGTILGPARNARMVAAGADICLAYPCPHSRGTWDCIRKAVAAGIETRIRLLKDCP